MNSSAGADVVVFEQESTGGYHSTGSVSGAVHRVLRRLIVRRLAMASRAFSNNRRLVSRTIRSRIRPVMFIGTTQQGSAH